jgi:hypothetical protein
MREVIIGPVKRDMVAIGKYQVFRHPTDRGKGESAINDRLWCRKFIPFTAFDDKARDKA